MQIDWWTVALQLLNFAVLVWLLQRFLYRPVTALIDRRRDEVAASFADAEKARDASIAARRNFERKGEALEAERLTILDQANARASAERTEILENAHEMARTREREASDLIDRERHTALTDLEDRSLDLAFGLSRRILSALASVALCEVFLDHAERHLSGLAEHERISLIDGAAVVTIRTAPRLDEATQRKWAARLAPHLGPGIKIEFEPDPEMIAGIELHLPRAQMRFSISDTLETMRKELSPDAGSEVRPRPMAS